MDKEENLIIDLLNKEKIDLIIEDLEFKISLNHIPIDKVINTFKIRYKIALDNQNVLLQEKFSTLLLSLEASSSEIESLRIISVRDKIKIYIIYANEKLTKIIGFIEGSIDR